MRSFSKCDRNFILISSLDFRSASATNSNARTSGHVLVPRNRDGARAADADAKFSAIFPQRGRRNRVNSEAMYYFRAGEVASEK